MLPYFVSCKTSSFQLMRSTSYCIHAYTSSRSCEVKDHCSLALACLKPDFERCDALFPNVVTYLEMVAMPTAAARRIQSEAESSGKRARGKQGIRNSRH